MDFIHLSWWGDWVHLTHTHNNWNSMHMASHTCAVSYSVIYLFVLFSLLSMVFSLVCRLRQQSATWNGHGIAFCLKCTICYWFDVQWAKGWWVSLCSFALTYEKYAVLRSNVCRYACFMHRRQPHTHTHSHFESQDAERIFQMPKYGT